MSDDNKPRTPVDKLVYALWQVTPVSFIYFSSSGYHVLSPDGVQGPIRHHEEARQLALQRAADLLTPPTEEKS